MYEYAIHCYRAGLTPCQDLDYCNPLGLALIEDLRVLSGKCHINKVYRGTITQSINSICTPFYIIILVLVHGKMLKLSCDISKGIGLSTFHNQLWLYLPSTQCVGHLLEHFHLKITQITLLHWSVVRLGAFSTTTPNKCACDLINSPQSDTSTDLPQGTAP